jgi:PAS domain S-box-containing protein
VVAVGRDDGGGEAESAVRTSAMTLVRTLDAAPAEALDAAMTAAGLGYIELDPETRTLSANAVARAHFGRGRGEDFTYEELLDGVHPDDVRRRAEALDRALNAGEDYRVVLRTRWPDGSRRWLEICGRAVERDGRRLFAAVSRDVTDQHFAEAALRESEERFRQIADSAPTPMWITEPGGARLFVNRAYVDFLGCSMAQAKGFDWRRILHPEDVDRVVRESIAGEAALEPFALEARYRRHDGQWRWLRSVSQPRRAPSGEYSGFIGIAIDITDNKLAQEELESANDRLEERVEAAVAEKLEAETALRQSQRLEAVGQLTSGVAHDFNNLLTVILGNIRQMAKTQDDPAALRRLATMTQAAERGAKLTGQLLAFSRRQRLEPRPTDLNETVRRMGDLLRSTTGGGIGVDLQLADDLRPAFVDPTQIELVILNLAINARDAMDGFGRLTIETANVALGPPRRPEEPPAGDYVMLSVSDTGSGMSEEVREKAFEPFFTTKGVGKGSGLGLSQVLGLAKQSDGGVGLDTRPGEGTSVRLYLPPTAQPVAGAEPARAIPRAAGRTITTVLLVDDDDAVREVTAAALEEVGYRVLDADSGPRALEMLDEQDGVDALLLDFAMPGMNGAEVAEIVRRTRPALPILFVTGYADVDALHAVPEREVVRKPFRPEDLAQKIDALVAAAPGGTAASLGH